MKFVNRFFVTKVRSKSVKKALHTKAPYASEKTRPEQQSSEACNAILILNPEKYIAVGRHRPRIAIARVFLKNPKLLILDEATSALDNATEMQVQSALEELSAGRTVIVVAHRLSTVKGADEIVVIGEDGIMEQGTHEQLIEKRGEYHKLYSYQFKNL